jgi:hypothetical protein
MAEFTATPVGDGVVRIAWSDDPLNFWDVAESEAEEAKRLVESGQFETQDGSTIPATVAICKRWLSEAR